MFAHCSVMRKRCIIAFHKVLNADMVLAYTTKIWFKHVNLHVLRDQQKSDYVKYTVGPSFSIHHFHIDHNATCLPPKILHNTFFSNLSRVMQSSQQKKSKRMVVQNLGGKQGAYYVKIANCVNCIH